jgi:hypothetical protein
MLFNWILFLILLLFVKNLLKLIETFAFILYIQQKTEKAIV